MEKRQMRSYTVEFKSEAVALVNRGEKSGAEIARNLGISSATLYTWVVKSRKGAFSERSHRHGVSDLVAENSRLQKELMLARMERDILKKATAFFAKESK